MAFIFLSNILDKHLKTDLPKTQFRKGSHQINQSGGGGGGGGGGGVIEEVIEEVIFVPNIYVCICFPLFYIMFGKVGCKAYN